MSGPDGFANSAAQRVKKVSNPEGAVVINMRSGTSLTFLKACTEFFGMNVAAPGQHCANLRYKMIRISHSRVMQQLLAPQELATIINVTPKTIMNWYYPEITPARIHVGRVIRFELDAVMIALEQVREVRRADDIFRRRRPMKRII